MSRYVFIAVLIMLAYQQSLLFADEPVRGLKNYSYINRVVEAIYKAEGGEKAVKPFGILSIPCDGYDHCRRICVNTVRNNIKRYYDYGHKDFDSYIEFLGSRYAPTKNASNDPQGLNKNWISNVNYFLTKGE